MKRLLIGLLSIAFAGVAHGASTDTVTIPVFVPETYQVVVSEPVEHKVVELHMSATPVNPMEEMKRHRRIDKLPLMRQGTCSGSFINAKGDILTAKHCVEGFDTFEVMTYDQKTYEAVVVATSTVHDLAILHIDRRKTPFFDLADTLTRGETIFVLGSPLGITDTLSTGVVARLDGDKTMIDCGALPGNSGGPLYNKDGKLVGVLTAGMIVLYGTTHLNVAQGLDAIVYFIEKTLKEKK